MWLGSRPWSRRDHHVLLVWLLVVLTCAAKGQSTCPVSTEIYPCLCIVESRGLEVTCGNTDGYHVKKAMKVFKAKSEVIAYLNISRSNMPTLQDRIFLGVDIRHLKITNSNLAVIEDSSMETGLQSLHLNWNMLSTVPPSSALHKLHQLTYLNLNFNQITVLHDRAFDGLAKLKSLTLYWNMISNVEDGSFIGLERKLTLLDIGKNQLSSIPTVALSRLSNLERLELHENQITNIEEGHFIGLNKLDTLDLSRNKLSRLNGRAFKGLNNLTDLDLEYNNIAHLDDDAFEGLEDQLTWLYLGNNNIQVIPSAALRRLNRLFRLDLGSNNISHIEEDAFQGYGNTIMILSLKENKIKTIATMTLVDLHSLMLLYLSTNNISHLPQEVVEPVLDTIYMIDLHDNPLVCDCELRWYKEWLEGKLQEDVLYRPLLKDTQCTFPSDGHNYSVLSLTPDKMHCTSHPEGMGVGRGSPLGLSCLSLLVTIATTTLLR